MEPRFWLPAMNASGVISQDGGMEVDLGTFYDSETNATISYAYWLYGDTMLGYFDPPKDPVWNGWATNTGMTVAITTFPNGTQSATADYSIDEHGSGRATEVIPFTEFEPIPHDFGIWPMGSFMYEDTVYTFFEVVNRKENSGFSHNSYGLAKMPVVLGGNFNFSRAINESSKIKYAPDWTMVDGDYVYTYFVAVEILTDGIKVGRIPISVFSANATFDYSSKGGVPYEFWSGIGDSFDSDFENSPAMVVGGFTQFSVFYNKYLGSYVLIHSSMFPIVNEILMYTAPTPWGPFSKPFMVFDSKLSMTKWIYCVYSHEMLFEDDGRVMYLTFSTNGVDFDAPTLVRIELT